MKIRGKTYVYGTAAEKLQYDVYEDNIVLRKKKQQRVNNKAKVKLVFNILLVFTAFFFLIYRYALITEVNYNIGKYNNMYNEIRNDNSRIKVEIESNLDLQKIKETAELKLGMQKPDKHQVVYVKVPKSDFTQLPESEGSEVAKTSGLIASLTEKIGQLTGFAYNYKELAME